jgi:hypothetical protein
VVKEFKKEEDIDCSIYSSFEDIYDLRKEWDSFIETIKGEIFLTFDWCRVWWKFYGKRRILRIFVLRRGDEIVAIVPLFIERIWIGIFPVKIAKIVGSDFTIAHFTFPVNVNYDRQAVIKFLEALDTQNWDLCCLWPLTCITVNIEYFSKLFLTSNQYQKIFIEEEGVQTTYELSKSWDDYLSNLKKRERKNIRKNYTKIKKNKLNLKCDLATKRNFENRFIDFVEVHQKRWKHSGRPGHFGDWPKSFKFHKEVASEQLQLGRLQLFKVQVEDDFAYRYCYEFGKRYFAFLAGRCLDVSNSGIDLGRLLFSEHTQQAINNGILNIDSMRGRYDYKLRLGGKLFPLARLHIVRKGIFRSIRLRMFKIICQILDLLYYKVWYCRLAPKLPFNYGPLWSLWIRINGIYSSKFTFLRRFHLSNFLNNED